MANPVLVEVTRGKRVESFHRGSVAVFDSDSKSVLSIGTTRTPVFPRSAIKLIQAIPLVETGAADDYGFTKKELALACASHSGEPAHAQTAAAMLRKAGLEPACLECGPHWPIMGPDDGRKELRRMAAAGETPSALHNNCSGKHAGFVCTAHHQGTSIEGYIKPDHIIQRSIRAIMEELTGQKIADDQCGMDGCSAPTFAVTLDGLASAFARLGSGVGLDRERATASGRLMRACMDEPWHVAGTGRACTKLMEGAQGRLFVKVGADGVYVAAIPELGLGVAIKCDDGSIRAAETMLAATLVRFIGKDPAIGRILEPYLDYPLINWNGNEVGRVRAAEF